MMGRTIIFLCVACCLGAPARAESEFIFGSAPFKSCHASTLAETTGGLVAAWFAGSDEGNKDVGIWLSLRRNDRWSPPVEVANGIQRDGSRLPCWNPVLFQQPSGPLLLFFKIGPKPSKWWGMMCTSEDEGKTWSAARRLPEGILGPIKNKPVQLADGAWLSPTSTEGNKDGWLVHFEISRDAGATWQKI